MPTYARPRLISSDDKRYRAYVEQFLIARRNQRAIRPPRQRDLFGGQAEAALRGWLAQQFTLSERRILEYEERRGNRGTMKYRELDGLVLEDRAAWAIEIKASRTASSLRRAVGQLNETKDPKAALPDCQGHRAAGRYGHPCRRRGGRRADGRRAPAVAPA